MINSSIRFWWALSSLWAEYLFGDDFKLEAADVGSQPKSPDSRLNWWEFINLDEVAPPTWYVKGEVVEA